MKICYDPRFFDIGVAIAMKWRHYVFYLPMYFSVPGVFVRNSLRELVLPLNKFYESVLEIFLNKVLRTNVTKDWANLEVVKQNLPSYFVGS